MDEGVKYAELTVFVTNQLPSGSAFGIHQDSGEQVFISSRAALSHNIHPGDTAHVRVIPNRYKDGAKWFAIYVNRILSTAAAGPETAPQPEPKTAPQPEPEGAWTLEEWEDALKKELKAGGPASTAQLAKALGCISWEPMPHLKRMHKSGEVALATVMQRADQQKASFLVWALNAADIIPDDVE